MDKAPIVMLLLGTVAVLVALSAFFLSAIFDIQSALFVSVMLLFFGVGCSAVAMLIAFIQILRD